MDKGMVVDLKLKSDEEVDIEVEEDVVLPGFRFHPTDEELVGFYLRRKVEKKRLSIDIIKQIDIYKYDPWDLTKTCSVGDDKEWYFFCLRGRKYRNSVRPNRVITGSGFWKATGIDRPIYAASDSGDCIGLKKSLVYYRGSAGKGTKTDWMMHEFRLPSKNHDTRSPPSSQEAEIWTICRIFKRDVSFMKKYTQSRRQTISKQVPADSSSKTGSFESDAGDGYRYANGIPSVEPNEGYLTNYCDYQLFGGQWNPTVQAPMPALHPNVTPNPNPTTSEFFKDGNWDEIGRIMEFELELDTNAANECIYY